MRSVSGTIGNIASMALTGRSATPPAVDSIARMLAFVRANLEKTADQMRPIEAGWVVTTPSLPAVWVLNQVRVVLPLEFASLVDLADQQLAASRYVQITVENQATGPDLERAFRDAGWKTDREVLMVLTAAPDREADTSIVTDAGEEETVDVMKRWYGQDEPARAALDQLGEYSRREARACGDRLLGVRSSDGRWWRSPSSAGTAALPRSRTSTPSPRRAVADTPGRWSPARPSSRAPAATI